MPEFPEPIDLSNVEPIRLRQLYLVDARAERMCAGTGDEYETNHVFHVWAFDPDEACSWITKHIHEQGHGYVVDVLIVGCCRD